MTGQVLTGRYEVVKLLGRGGFGETHLAIDRFLPAHPRCVVKRLLPHQAIADVNLRLFNREAEILYQLGEHPQIPALQAHFEQDGAFYLVQDYIEGHDLTQEIRAGVKWEESMVIQLLIEILEILTFVHSKNIIHRDLKPANVMRRHSDHQLVLIDFGSVKQLTGQPTEESNQPGWTIGINSQGYSPLEQLEGRPQLSSDIYAVGMIGIHALTAMLPSTLPRDPRSYEVAWRDLTQISDTFAAVLGRMVVLNVSQRYPSAVEALAALKTLQNPSRQNLSNTAETQPTSTVAPTRSPRLGFLRSLLPRRQPVLKVTTQLQRSFPAHTGGVRAASLTSNGQTLISSGSDRLIKVWDLSTERQLLTLQGHGAAVNDLELDRTGHLVLSASEDKTVRIWQIPSGEERFLLRLGSEWATQVVISPDTQTAITSCNDNTLKFWHVGTQNTGELLKSLQGHQGLITSLGLSHDGELLVSGSEDRTLRLWQPHKAQLLTVLRGHQEGVNCLAMSTPWMELPLSAQQLIVSGSSDQTIRLWDGQQGTELRILKGHTGRVTVLALHPSGMILASGGSDQVIKLWDLAKGTELISLRGHRGIISSLAFSASGKRLVSGSWDGTLKIWAVDQEFS